MSGFYEQVFDTFAWFHRHPELPFEEYETTARIRGFLEHHGVPILPLELETGLVAEVRGGRPGPVVALRCDIDALPIQEESGLPYASEAAGKMHACGHDFHTAVMLYVAKNLQEKRADLQGTVKVIFQPAEESSIGAYGVLKTGVLNGVSAVYGIHTDVSLPVGTLGVASGAVTAAVDRFLVKLAGKGTHAAHPHDGIDIVLVAAQIVTAAQSIVSRNIDPFSQGLLSITRVTAGNTWNVIPDTAELEGTVRTMDKANRILIEERLRALVEHVALSQGARAELEWMAGPPATDNAPCFEPLIAAVAGVCGLAVSPGHPSLGGEDFSLFQEQTPGFYIRVGTGASYPGHHPKFRVDPAALEPAVGYFTELARQSLVEIGQGRLEPVQREERL